MLQSTTCPDFVVLRFDPSPRNKILMNCFQGVVAGEAAGGDAPAAAAPSAPALTEEEKFAKAQEKFAGKVCSSCCTVV